MSEEMIDNQEMNNQGVKVMIPDLSGKIPLNHAELDKQLYDVRNEMLEALSYIHMLENRHTRLDYSIQSTAHWLTVVIDNLNDLIMRNLKEWSKELSFDFPSYKEYEV